MLPAKLTYLFVADFKDGSRYFQNESDTSMSHPLTKSGFWDVLQRLDQVTKFTLTDSVHEHSVFLDDGHFKTDGEILVSPHKELTNYRLIYYRRCQQIVSNGLLERPKIVAYFLGWQANDFQGKNFQMLLRVPPSGTFSPVIVEQK